MSSISLMTDLHPSRIPAITLLSKSWFSFSKLTTFIIIFIFSYIHLIRMPFQIAFSDRLNVLLPMAKQLFLADILGSLIRFSWRRRRMFFCVRSVLLRPKRSLFRFKLDPWLLYLLKKIKMVIFVDATLSRNSCCWTSLRLLVLT